jgi:hypothetical protein
VKAHLAYENDELFDGIPMPEWRDMLFQVAQLRLKGPLPFDQFLKEFLPLLEWQNPNVIRIFLRHGPMSSRLSNTTK